MITAKPEFTTNRYRTKFTKIVKPHPHCVNRLIQATSHRCMHKLRTCVEHILGQLCCSANNTYHYYFRDDSTPFATVRRQTSNRSSEYYVAFITLSSMEQNQNLHPQKTVQKEDWTNYLQNLLMSNSLCHRRVRLDDSTKFRHWCTVQRSFLCTLRREGMITGHSRTPSIV